MQSSLFLLVSDHCYLAWTYLAACTYCRFMRSIVYNLDSLRYVANCMERDLHCNCWCIAALKIVAYLIRAGDKERM